MAFILKGNRLPVGRKQQQRELLRSNAVLLYIYENIETSKKGSFIITLKVVDVKLLHSRRVVRCSEQKKPLFGSRHF